MGGSKFKVTENQVLLTVYFQFQMIHKMIKCEAAYFPTITGYSELSWWGNHPMIEYSPSQSRYSTRVGLWSD